MIKDYTDDELKKYQEITNDNPVDCYPGTKILINKMNIMNQEILDAREKMIVSSELVHMALTKYDGEFNIEHYKEVHFNMFNDIYPFAGQFRAVDIRKGQTYFCRSFFVYGSLEKTLIEMNSDMNNINNEDEYSKKLAKYYSDLNYIHPFREGNGRTLREFLRQYVLHLNDVLSLEPRELNYSEMDQAKLYKYTISDNNEGLASEFKKALVVINNPEKEKTR